MHRLRVEGAAFTSVGSPTAVSIVSNAAGDHDVTFTKTAHDCSVNDWLQITALAGTGGFAQLNGMWKVTAVPAADTFTVKNTSQNATITATVTSGTVKKVNTILEYTGANIRDSARNPNGTNPGALQIMGSGVTFDSLGIISNGADADAHGVMLNHDAHALFDTDVCINGFAAQGIWCLYNSTCAIDNGVVISNVGGQGFVAHFGGVITGGSSYATGCVSHGARVRDAGLLTLPGLVSSGNGSGASGEGNGSLVISNASLDYNAGPGVTLTSGVFANLTGSHANNNATWGIIGTTGSRVLVDTFTATGNTTGSASLTGCQLLGTPTSLVTPTLATTLKDNSIETAAINGATIASTVIGSGGATVLKVLTASLAVNIASIAANTQVSQAVTVTGVNNGADWTCSVNSNVALPAGLIMSLGHVSANTVTFFLTNPTAGALDPANMTYRVTAMQVA